MLQAVVIYLGPYLKKYQIALAETGQLDGAKGFRRSTDV
jgi:hypothetical protein